eukprot:3049747-Rhodomonas_salina.2
MQAWPFNLDLPTDAHGDSHRKKERARDLVVLLPRQQIRRGVHKEARRHQSVVMQRFRRQSVRHRRVPVRHPQVPASRRPVSNPQAPRYLPVPFLSHIRGSAVNALRHSYCSIPLT